MLFEPNDEKQTVEAQGKGPQTQGTTAAKALEQRQGIEARAKSVVKTVLWRALWLVRYGGVIPNVLGSLGGLSIGQQTLPVNALKVSSAPATKKIVLSRGPELKEELRRETMGGLGQEADRGRQRPFQGVFPWCPLIQFFHRGNLQVLRSPWNL